jgi:hypothetical protein
MSPLGSRKMKFSTQKDRKRFSRLYQNRPVSPPMVWATEKRLKLSRTKFFCLCVSVGLYSSCSCLALVFHDFGFATQCVGANIKLFFGKPANGTCILIKRTRLIIKPGGTRCRLGRYDICGISTGGLIGVSLTFDRIRILAAYQQQKYCSGHIHGILHTFSPTFLSS